MIRDRQFSQARLDSLLGYGECRGGVARPYMLLDAEHRYPRADFRPVRSRVRTTSTFLSEHPISFFIFPSEADINRRQY